MNDFDPVQYGRLLYAVEQLEARVSDMESDIKKLLELANKSKGGFWVGMTIASFIGGVITFIADHVFGK